MNHSTDCFKEEPATTADRLNWPLVHPAPEQHRGKPLEDELVELTRSFGRGFIEEDTYLKAKEKVVHEKNRLKQEKQPLQRSRESNWVEPARKLVDILQTLGKDDIEKNLSEISGIVQKIGTSRLVLGKTCSLPISKTSILPRLYWLP